MSAGESEIRVEKPATALRRGWTTGACATAATKAALTALLSGDFPDPVQITLPKGETPSFPLAREALAKDHAMAGIIKDAGDDPDVTHGALVMASVRRLSDGAGSVFKAGPGVGTVTRAGLPIPPGEAAINPVPRRMMSEVVTAHCDAHGIAPDIEIEIAIENGAELALQTWNPRLGIIGGLSVLGTTGVVHPYSCAAWIHSIHRGIDVARAEGFPHVLGATGSTSEKTAQDFHKLSDVACLDMGDFAGGLLVGGGLVLVALAFAEFRRHKTTVIPHREADRLIQTGIFRRSRNPIYLADVLVLAGLILRWDAVLSLVLIPAFMALIEKRFIRGEEIRIRQEFGAAFDSYAARVRRWL